MSRFLSVPYRLCTPQPPPRSPFDTRAVLEHCWTGQQGKAPPGSFTVWQALRLSSAFKTVTTLEPWRVSLCGNGRSRRSGPAVTPQCWAVCKALSHTSRWNFTAIPEVCSPVLSDLRPKSCKAKRIRFCTSPHFFWAWGLAHFSVVGQIFSYVLSFVGTFVAWKEPTGRKDLSKDQWLCRKHFIERGGKWTTVCWSSALKHIWD